MKFNKKIGCSHIERSQSEHIFIQVSSKDLIFIQKFNLFSNFSPLLIPQLKKSSDKDKSLIRSGGHPIFSIRPGF